MPTIYFLELINSKNNSFRIYEKEAMRKKRQRALFHISQEAILFNEFSNPYLPGVPYTKLCMTELIHKTRLSTHFCPKLCSNFITL